MRKSTLRRKKRSYEKALNKIEAARSKAKRLRTQYEGLPEQIESWERLVRRDEQRLAVLEDRLTQPLFDYANRTVWRGGADPVHEFSSKKAQDVYDARQRLKWDREVLERKREELDDGVEDQLAGIHKTIKDLESEARILGRDLAQYAILYAEQRKDIALTDVPTVTEQGSTYYPIDGVVAVTVDLGPEEGEKTTYGTVLALVNFLLKPHLKRLSRSSSQEPEEGPRELSARREGEWWVMGSHDLYRALRGLATSGAVDICGCLIGLRGIRAYLREIDNSQIAVKPNGGSHIDIKSEVPGLAAHRSVIRDGAWTNRLEPAGTVVFREA